MQWVHDHWEADGPEDFAPPMEILRIEHWKKNIVRVECRKMRNDRQGQFFIVYTHKNNVYPYLSEKGRKEVDSGNMVTIYKPEEWE